MRGAYPGLLLILLLALPPVRGAMESNMAIHMLLQIPLIVAGGWWIGVRRPKLLDLWDPQGVAILTVAIFSASWWMVPRALDAALFSPWADLAKFASLSLLAGVPLRWCWEMLHPLVRGFVWANLISMLFVLGWLYLAAPLRVCNGYLLDQQSAAGYGFLLAGALISLWLVASLFIGKEERVQEWS